MRNKANGKKSFHSTGLIVTAVLAWLVLMLCLGFVADSRRVRFYVTGEPTMTVEHGSEYSDPGVYAVTVGRLFGEGKKKLDINTLTPIEAMNEIYKMQKKVCEIYGEN